MSKEKDIDDFFKKQLENIAEADDGWNIPSDDLWAAAKEEINTPKKKKRIIFWFFSGCLLLFIGLASFLSYTNYQTKEKQQLQKVVLDNNKNTEAKDKISLSTNEQKNQKDSSSENQFKLKKKPTVTIIKKNSKKLLTPKSQLAKTYLGNKNSVTIAKLNLGENYLIDSTTLKTPSKQKTLKTNLASNFKKLTFNHSINLPTLKSRLYVNFDHSKILNIKAPTIPTLDKRPSIKKSNLAWKYRIGIAHSRFLANPFTVVTAKDYQNNKYIELLSSSYRSLDISLAKALRGNWSITSGVLFLRQRINVRFGFDSLIYNGQNGQLKETLESGLAQGFVKKTFAKGLDLIFLPNANVTIGDTLTLFGELPIQLKDWQIPIFWNYHVRKQKVDLLFSAGFSLDIIKIAVDSLPITASHNNILISNETTFKSYETTLLGATFYLGAGLQYDLNNQFALSANYKLNLLKSEFSRYQLGLFYTIK